MASDSMKDGAGGGAGSTFPFRQILSTPRASDMKAGGHGDTGRMGTVRHQLAQARMATHRATDADRGGRGDVLSQLRGYPSKHAGMPPKSASALLATPTSRDWRSGKASEATMSRNSRPLNEQLEAARAMLPTPVKNDRKMEKWSDAYARRTSPKLDAMLDGAMRGELTNGHGFSHTPTTKGNQTAPSMMKWAGARALASLLQSHGLTGTAALPITYGWMMGFPPGWLARAFRSAMEKGSLLPASPSRRSATPSSRKSRKPLDAPSTASSEL